MQPQLRGQPVRLLVLTPPGKVWKPGIPHPIGGSEDVLSSCQAVPDHCILCTIPPETAQKQLVHSSWERQELSPGSLLDSSLVQFCRLNWGWDQGSNGGWWLQTSLSRTTLKLNEALRLNSKKLSCRFGILKGIYIWRTFSFCGSSGFPQVAC